MATELAGGLVLAAATVAALVWANSPWSAGYETAWSTDLTLGLGERSLTLDVRHWVNEGLMAVFFLVAALEVKRELVDGELREPRRAALPVVAAIGGMVVPAVIYAAIAGGRGWGIPMATDIAFALGVAALLGRGLPAAVRLFLLTLAIVDDIGAIVVIAVFYSDAVDGRWLAAAAVCAVAAYGCARAGFLFAPLFVGLGVVLWLLLHESGVHATIAGVVMGLIAPARAAGASASPVERLEHRLHPWASLLIVPLFALANAGVRVDGAALGDAVSSPVTAGVVAGLVVGKFAGITGFAWLACRCRVAALPAGARWVHVAAMGALGGIGFTVSLFVTGLAFGADAAAIDEAKIGILIATLLASTLGGALLLIARRGDGVQHGA